MSLVDQVAADGRVEFLSSIKKVITHIRNKASQSSGRPNDARSTESSEKGTASTQGYDSVRHDVEQLIRSLANDNCAICLQCTSDVKELVDHLFLNGSLLDIGLKSIDLIQTEPPNRRERSEDTTKSQQIYLIRPTFEDAGILKAVMSYDRSECFVLCLPGASEMFPDVLQGVLRKDFTVVRGIGKQTGNRIVHLFDCNVHMAPLESCALSMFISRSMESFYMEGDPMASWFFAKAVEHLESRILDGAINLLTCLGHLARFSGEILIKSRRDCAAELIVNSTKHSSVSSDMPFLTRELRNQRLLTDMPTSGTDEDPSATVNLDTQRRMKLLKQSGTIDEAVIIDRRVDMVTPMCLNVTYEGLLDNVFGITNGSLQCPLGVVDGSVGDASGILEQYRSNFGTLFPDTTVVPLRSSLYREIRWLNYSEVGKHLHQRALQVHKGYERGDLATLDEMGAFVKKFKNLQKEHSELSIHVNMMSWMNSLISGDCMQLLHQLEDSILQSATDIKPDDSKIASLTAKIFNKPSDPCVQLFLDLIYWNVDVTQVYRLLILLSQTRDGVKSSELQSIKRAIVDQYGFCQLMTLHKLETMGLIRINDSPDGLRWARLCKKLNLLVDRENATADYASIFGGYAPISVRLFQLIILARNVSSVEADLRLLDCPVAVLRQKSVLPGNPTGRSHCKLLGFLGGVTLGEIAAIAALNQKRGEQTLILATNVISMKSMLGPSN
ncbi:Sec1 family protein [Babesia bovis T2Bo]|uniref:Uncharacterized protein n=1 Tax=Babesia bovis TaxID=5865 RepID=A7AP08_BABBO|nr:Sec1 family protein [Babesia bovis T2Bo]EDO08292.1 Sec1 family protein [Babesia bovis T2Bo]|eukprot:XP_001611860.1 hypothetical protein [Babesia bovis T2Bo]